MSTILQQSRFLKGKQDKNLAPRTDYGLAPKGYVPGAARGAVGFTTRSDIGPARQAVIATDRSLTAQRERARQVLIASQTGPRSENLNESNFDAFTGYSHSLFSTGSYDGEDREADTIYQTIDQRMDEKRKRRREERAESTWSEYHKKRPRPSEFFITERKQLKGLSLEEWDSIPKALDFASRKKEKKETREKFNRIPDHIIQNARSLNTGSVSGSITAYPGMDAQHGGLTTIMPMTTGTRTDLFGKGDKGYLTDIMGRKGGAITDMMHLGQIRGQNLGSQLDRASDSVSGQTVVDPKGYLTDLTSFTVTSDTDLSDIQKARALLNNVVESNREHPPGWIAAARLEEQVCKLPRARKLIMKATEACGDSQDIWLEAARLHGRKQARAIVARAVQRIPRSPKIWIKASMLEKEVENKKAVLRRALEFIPDSVALWKATVELEENPEEAKILLARAVECVPTSVEMWLALARLEDYEKSRQVLNKARKQIPTDPIIWIAAAKLEEKQGNPKNIPKIIGKSEKSLTAHKVVIEREQWLEEASKCEKDNNPLTCEAIVRETVGIGIEEQDREEMWKQDAKNWLEKGAVHTARAIYDHLLKHFPRKWKIWWEAAKLEKNFGTNENVSVILNQAVQFCPKDVPLFLLFGKHKWRTENDINGAREILLKAFASNPENEQIWLAAVKLEAETKEYDAARKLLRMAQKKCSTPKVWMKSAVFERSLNNTEEVLNLLKKGLKIYKDFDKLWMMKAQYYEQSRDRFSSLKTLKESVKYVPFSENVWLEYARLEVANGSINRARAVLETARSKIPRSDKLWLASCELELKTNTQQAVLSKALLECPTSGRLWSFSIECEQLNQQKAKCLLALEKLPENVHVLCEVAKFFWRSGKMKQAKDWFERGIVAEPTWGDTWCWYSSFFQKTKRKQKDLISIQARCVAAEPTHGKYWVQVSKKVGNEMCKKDEIFLQVVKLLPDIHEKSLKTLKRIKIGS